MKMRVFTMMLCTIVLLFIVGECIEDNPSGREMKEDKVIQKSTQRKLEKSKTLYYRTASEKNRNPSFADKKFSQQMKKQKQNRKGKHGSSLLDKIPDEDKLTAVNATSIVTSRVKTGKKAIVTFLCGLSRNLIERYADFLRAFAYSLRKSGYTDEILVLHTPEFPLQSIRTTIDRYQLNTKAIHRVTIPDKGVYEHLMTKLQIWKLIDYDQVMYYDVDFVFQQNPINAFEDCGEDTPLCAVKDQGIKDYGVDYRIEVQPENYFNAGFLVIIPDKQIYKMLMNQIEDAAQYPFLEQDLLNKFYARKWKRLKIEYNVMHSIKRNEITSDVIAVHEKLEVLQRKFGDRKYIWNQQFRR